MSPTISPYAHCYVLRVHRHSVAADYATCPKPLSSSSCVFVEVVHGQKHLSYYSFSVLLVDQQVDLGLYVAVRPWMIHRVSEVANGCDRWKDSSHVGEVGIESARDCGPVGRS